MALSGTFGYELDITRISEEERSMIPEQTAMYHKYHDLIREGDYFRIASYRENHLYDCWASSAKDRGEVLVTYVQVLGQAMDIAAEKENMELPPATSVNYIASGAFGKCSNLQSVIVPDSVAGISENAFAGVTSEKLVLNFQSETPLKLMQSSEGSAYSFGVDDSKLEIHVPEGCEEAYITEWRYVLSGYADLEAVKQAVTNDLTGEYGTAPAEEEIEKETAKRLLPAENRLRVMMGMEPVEADETETLSEEIFNDGVHI